ncbi:MAG: sulfate adenylyltransferase [SAR324 cluster bacterium]|jgi:sulfate adenylyltransferase|nr:sulfate adenylyltransferase [SAR324 cluster bacterium]MDP7139639.1 sulfate adenylyltransferase [SAR324 cluster bacterium]MDP7332854.1 sulfate adenylyltransferase [SAR324 cluster bacterium]MDP7501373.1 sulfate adenylyltransferase [SAR324 cluster bacterium]HJO45799.1 sulfate adenylyltransferase [SAR324 cluster bacterium]|tara:strand:- start:278 stop:1528 length:1251 start_codon:yes stop_codon:yes gene_type:complete
MIKPHGSDTLNPLLVSSPSRLSQLQKEAANLPSIVVCSAAAANAVMMGSGYFNPLSGFMNLADALSVTGKMHTTHGLFWPTPVVNVVQNAGLVEGSKRIALRDPNVEGNPVVAIQDIEAIEEATAEQMEWMTEKIYRTKDMNHPGVSAFNTVGNIFISGPIQVLNLSYFEKDFPETFRTAVQIREMIVKNGWETIVAFQTRNPMHRAHEELVRIAMERVNADGAIIHMLLGKLKKGDIPADIRDACIRRMVELYFPPNSIEITGYGFDMLYAGPREAVLHAIFRQNMGATHLIVGRDHAGVGDYYGGFDAQTIFHEEVPEDALELKIFEADHTAFSKKIGKVIMMREAPEGHTKEDFVLLSGTKVRAMLSAGEDLPPEFARPEVARIMMDFYQDQAASKNEPSSKSVKGEETKSQD